MILAGMTLYNPDIRSMKENIAAIYSQVDKLICVDNGSTDVEALEKIILEDFPKTHIIKNGENVGVAVALNQMFGYAKDNDYEWVLTLDQDSYCPNNLIEEYKKYMGLEKLGCLCPIICDRHYENKEKLQGEYTEVDKCITSACLTSVGIWEEVGGFLSDLFIDFVDHDFCAKLIETGYKIIRVNTVALQHEIGWGKSYKFFGRRITALNHPPFRKYYMVRNWVYYIKVHKKTINVAEEYSKLIFFFVKTIIYEKNRKQKLKEMVRGLKDAKKFYESHAK